VSKITESISMPTTAWVIWAWIVTSQLQIKVRFTQQVEGPKGVESISHGGIDND
jgi:hypothetical protein